MGYDSCRPCFTSTFNPCGCEYNQCGCNSPYSGFNFVMQNLINIGGSIDLSAVMQNTADVSSNAEIGDTIDVTAFKVEDVSDD